MRYAVTRFRASSALASLALLSTILSGCGRLNPNGEHAAVTLLKAGSEKVCVDPEVQSTLRDNLLPRVDKDDGRIADMRKAAEAVSFTYSTTTLASFDKVTSKATCDTMLEVHGPSDSSNSFHISYTITPSADQAGSFVISSDAADARSYILAMINLAMAANDSQSADTNEMEGDDQPAAPTVDESSVVGAWIKTRQAGAACHSGSAITFQPDHVIVGGLGHGRWALTGNTLHLVTDAIRTSDVNADILAADAISMTLGMPGNARLTLRRCSNEELQAPPEPQIDPSMNQAAPSPAGETQ